jgi:phage baseplate assembly protein V
MFGLERDWTRTQGVGTPEQTENERRLADVVKSGRVIETDYAKARVRVGIGDPADAEGYIKTGWLPMAGGRSDEWNPLQVGEAVMVLSESGDLPNGVVIPATIYNEDNPAVGDRGDLWRKDFRDGSSIEYDLGSKTMKTTVGGATTTITEEQIVHAIGDATVTIQNGSITLSAGGQTLVVGGEGAVSSGRIRGNDGLEIDGPIFTHNGVDVGEEHRHENTQPGSGLSGQPQG